MIYFLEINSTTKATPTVSVPVTTPSTISNTPTPASPAQKTKRDKLDRIRRQIALVNDLSSDVDESENLGIEQVQIGLK